MNLCVGAVLDVCPVAKIRRGVVSPRAVTVEDYQTFWPRANERGCDKRMYGHMLLAAVAAECDHQIAFVRHPSFQDAANFRAASWLRTSHVAGA
jgi:hypothetical protein